MNPVGTLLFAVLFTVPAFAQVGGPALGGGPPRLAIELVPAKTSAKLTITSSAFKAGAILDGKYTQNGDNISPPIAWSKAPAGTQSYVVLVEEAGVSQKEPISHWVVYDIPPTTMSFPERVPRDPKLHSNAMQGRNTADSAGYLGPKSLPNVSQSYHFEVFALDTKLNLAPANTDRNAVVNAMKDHVLASGEITANHTAV